MSASVSPACVECHLPGASQSTTQSACVEGLSIIYYFIAFVTECTAYERCSAVHSAAVTQRAPPAQHVAVMMMLCNESLRRYCIAVCISFVLVAAAPSAGVQSEQYKQPARGPATDNRYVAELFEELVEYTSWAF